MNISLQHLASMRLCEWRTRAMRRRRFIWDVTISREVPNEIPPGDLDAIIGPPRRDLHSMRFAAGKTLAARLKTRRWST
jgi:hypothetical protein